MMKHEFEELAIRGNATISNYLYDTIERFYLSDMTITPRMAELTKANRRL